MAAWKLSCSDWFSVYINIPSGGEDGYYKSGWFNKKKFKRCLKREMGVRYKFA